MLIQKKFLGFVASKYNIFFESDVQEILRQKHVLKDFCMLRKTTITNKVFFVDEDNSFQFTCDLLDVVTKKNYNNKISKYFTKRYTILVEKDFNGSTKKDGYLK